MLHSFKLSVVAINVIKGGRQLFYFMKGFREREIFLLKEDD